MQLTLMQRDRWNDLDATADRCNETGVTTSMQRLTDATDSLIIMQMGSTNVIDGYVDNYLSTAHRTVSLLRLFPEAQDLCDTKLLAK
jgi:hypothetical protein